MEVDKHSYRALEGTNKNNDDRPTNTTKFYHLDWYMLPCKLAYLFELGKDFAYQPFLVLFLIGTGLTEPEASFIAGVRLVGMIVGSPFWGYVSDRYSNHRLVALLLCLFSIILMCSQPFLSVLVGNKVTNVCLHNNNQTIHFSASGSEAGLYRSKLFVLMLLTNIGASFMDGSTMGMIDAGIVHRVKTASKKKDFGWNRSFGGFGFAGGSFLSGLVIEWFPRAAVNCYSGIFIVYFVCVFGLMVSAWFLYSGKKMITVFTRNKESIWKPLCVTLKRFDNIVFYITVLIVGIQQGVFVTFTTVTLKELQASSLVQGLSISLAGISCIFSIALSTRMISFFGGTWNTIIFCALTWVPRFMIFAYISNPNLAIPISLIQAFGLGLFITASVHHVGLTSPNGLKTTLLGLMNGVHFGAGFIIASIVGGQVFERYGSKTLFLSSAILMLIWSLLLILYSLFCAKKAKETKYEITQQQNLYNKL